MPRRHDIPIIMLAEDDIEKEAWRAGVNDCQRKPKGVDELASQPSSGLLKMPKRKKQSPRSD